MKAKLSIAIRKELGLILGAVIFFSPLQARAQSEVVPTYLSQVALFSRCFAHLTQQRPMLTDPLFLDVKAGRKTAVQACTLVLDSAKLSADGGTKIANVNNQTAKKVLSSLHQLHRSWSRERGLAQRIFDIEGHYSLRAWYEDMPMGSFITRALFAPGKNVDSIVTGKDFLQPVRVTMNPPQVFSGIPNPLANPPTDWRLRRSQPIAPRDDILGIRTVTLPPSPVLTPIRMNGEIPDLATMYTNPATTTFPTAINYADVTALSTPIAPNTVNFGVRFTAKLSIPKTGPYTFFLDILDDFGILIIDNERVHATRTSGTPVTLTAGLHNLELQYFQRANTAKAILSWEGPTITKQVIPALSFVGLKAEYYTHRGYPSIQFTGSEGGGFIGNHNYLLTTYSPTTINFVPNGQILTDRSYARAVIRDTLCREVPVARESDAEVFVSATSDTPFRKEAACAVCHATLDRLAGATVRGLRWQVVPQLRLTSPPEILYGTLGIHFITPSFTSDSSWPATLDVDYARRAPSGHLYFRNYRGDLINLPIKSFSELASAISKQDDYYICFAKRYYNYFTGIDAVWGDPGDPTYPSLSKSEGYHLDTVIKLGLALKQHKSLRQLILDIISSDEYKMTDYGVTYGGPD